MIYYMLSKQKNIRDCIYYLFNLTTRKQYQRDMNQNYMGQTVDMICFNSECIKNGQQLFSNNSDKVLHTQHLLQQCISLHLHPLHKLEKNQKRMIEQLILGFDQQVLNEIQVKLQQLRVNIGQRYKQYSAQLYQSYIKSCPKLLNQQMLTKMKQNNDSTQEVNLINTLYAEKQGISKKLLSSILQPVFQSLQRQMLEVTIRIQTLIQQTNYFFKDKENNHAQMKSKNNQFQKNLGYEIKRQADQEIKEMHRKSKPISKIYHTKMSQNKIAKTNPNPQLKPFIRPKMGNFDYISRSKNGRFMKKNIVQKMRNTKAEKFINERIEQMAQKQIQTPQKKDSENYRLQLNQIEEEVSYQEPSVSMNQQSLNEEGQPMQMEDEQESEKSHDFMQIRTQKANKRFDQVIINSQDDARKIYILPQGIESQKIVIFYEITEELLITLINKLKPTKIILNCKINLTKRLNYQIAQRVLKKIEFFQEHWDHNTYFFEIAKSKHFPNHFQSYKQPAKKNHFKLYFLSKLKSIKNLWISSPKDLLQLKLSQLNIGKLQYLRLQPCICCKNNSFFSDSLEYFKKLTSLRTIIIKRCNINEWNRRALHNLFRKNCNLECVFLQNNLKIDYNYLSILQKLNITKLAVINENCHSVILKSDEVFTLQNLKYLYLNSVQIHNTENYQINSIQNRDQELVSKFKNLQKLTFLDLYNSDIHPQFIAYLHPKVYSQLTYLNLGYNVIDNQFTIPHLRRFQSLTYLQLDGTCLDLERFFSPQENQYRINETIRYLSLRWFTGNQNESKPKFRTTNYYPLTQRNFEMLVQSFPKVEYLNISDSRDVIGQVHFKDLVYLRDLCVDQRYTNIRDFIEKMNKLQISVFKWKQVNKIV